MATILFWNINRRQMESDLYKLCKQCGVDILILAESGVSDSRLISLLNEDGKDIYKAPARPSSRLSYYIRYPLASYKPKFDEGGISISHITPPVGADIILVALHLPSKLYMNNDEQMAHSIRLAEIIDEVEKEIGHNRTIVIGDLNMNPFDSGMVVANGLHSVMDRNIALKESRLVQGKQYKFFYNPMWGRMGDTTIGPPGTYYYDKSGYICYFWNTFDQVLLRPDLLDFFSDDKLQILADIKGKSIISSGKIDLDISDHLPILIELNIELDIEGGTRK